MHSLLGLLRYKLGHKRLQVLSNPCTTIHVTYIYVKCFEIRTMKPFTSIQLKLKQSQYITINNRQKLIPILI